MNRILTTTLLQAVKEVYTRYNSKTLPVLNYVLIQEQEGRLMLASTDLTTFNTAHASAIIEDAFTTCVPMKPLRDWLAVTAKYTEIIELSFEARTQTLRIKADNTRAEFKCIDAQEFPAIRPSAPIAKLAKAFLKANDAAKKAHKKAEAAETSAERHLLHLKADNASKAMNKAYIALSEAAGYAPTIERAEVLQYERILQ